MDFVALLSQKIEKALEVAAGSLLGLIVIDKHLAICSAQKDHGADLVRDEETIIPELAVLPQPIADVVFHAAVHRFAGIKVFAQLHGGDGGKGDGIAGTLRPRERNGVVIQRQQERVAPEDAVEKDAQGDDQEREQDTF